MQSFLDTPFIDFNTPLDFNKEDDLFDDLFFKKAEPEWNFLTSAPSSASTNYNNQSCMKSVDTLSQCMSNEEMILEIPKGNNAFRFCELLTNEILIQLDDLQFCDQLTACLNTIMKNIIYATGCAVTNTKSFELYPVNIILAVWNERKKLLALQKSFNSTQLTSDDWLSMFSLAELSKFLERITNNYQDVDSFMKFRDSIGKEIFLKTYQKMLITCNVIVVNAVLMSKMLNDETLLFEIPNLKDLAMMAHEYWLYQHYNHGTHKFAGECCKSCETCTSPSLPEDFSAKLQQANKHFEALIQFYSEIDAMKTQFLGSEILTKLVTFWTKVLWN